MMSEHDFHQIPVLENGAVVGLLTRGQIIRFLQLRQSLPAAPGRSTTTGQPGAGPSGTIEQHRIQSD
jgi:CBS domain-containing protein